MVDGKVQMIKSLTIAFIIWISGCSSTPQSITSAPTNENYPAISDISKPPKPRSHDPNLFTEVKSKTEWPSFEVEFNSNDYTYELKQNGRGKRSGKSAILALDLRLDKDESLERLIYYASYRDDIVLICESSIGDGSGGFIVRLDARTLKLKWKLTFPAFNIGQGLLFHNSAFVTGIGLVGRVDLESGKFLWKHVDLYGQKDGAFNSLEAPQIIDGIVRFSESENYLRKTLASLDVDIETGKIVKIER